MRHWTLEERLRQAELIKKWKPWEKGGVKTATGKQRSRMNAYKHGGRSAEIRELDRLMAECGRLQRRLRGKI